MSLSLEQAQGLNAGELAALPATELMKLQGHASESLNKAKACKEFIEGAIALKYEQQAQALRQQQGKDTGSVHFEDAGIRITADLPKRPAWDQKKLAEVVRCIQDAGDDPAEFVDVTYKVAERKYNAWPESLRASFAPARTLTTGKPVYRLSTTEET